MPTLNNKFARAKSSLTQLRDELERRASSLENDFPAESQNLYDQAINLDKIIQKDFDNSMNPIQKSCNLGDKFEIFNK